MKRSFYDIKKVGTKVILGIKNPSGMKHIIISYKSSNYFLQIKKTENLIKKDRILYFQYNFKPYFTHRNIIPKTLKDNLIIFQ